MKDTTVDSGKKAIKVCHLTSVHHAEDGRILKECISCANAGYETYLVEEGASYNKEGVHIKGLGFPKRKNRLYRMTVFSKIAYHVARETDADIYQLHDPELLPFAKKFKRLGKYVVFDCHERYVEQIRSKPYLPKIVARLISYLFDKYSKHVYKHIDGFIHPVYDEYVASLEPICKRIVTVNNYPWLNELYDSFDPKSVKEPNTACYVGGLSEDRGITQTIKACYSAGCKLYLAGEFSSIQYQQELENMKEYSCVEYLGILDRSGIVKLLGKTTLGLCLLLDVGQYYRMKNLATKVFEYMSMGMPVVVSDSEYNIETIKKLDIGYCTDPMDVENTGKLIRFILDDEVCQKRFGENGRKMIKNEYCWDIEQNRLLNLYKDIMAGNN